ncbi:MAG TPA: membrane protein insertase YidC [Mycobacteriales bacterium]|nr:membrane protein insertase YidC [Mycobacteriales bacterium]
MLDFLYYGISWVLLRWHELLSHVIAANQGLNWALSIMLLVITIRVVLFRFFVRQIRNQRKMQELQPKIAALRVKYKNDRQTMSQELMKLNREAGYNPLSGCLPVVLQAPVFLALFHVLRRLKPGRPALYGWTPDQMDSASHAKLFGAPISAAFRTPVETITGLGADPTRVRTVTAVMVLFMVVATYITQRQIMARTAQQAVDRQQAMVQKMMLYGIPASLLISGFIFPVGVLCYWLTNNIWTMGQQFYILKKMPHPGAAQEPAKPKVDPKLLAPKPGARPVNPKSRRPGPAAPGVEAIGVETAVEGTVEEKAQMNGEANGKVAGRAGAERAGAPAGAGRPTKPRPGKRPAGTRPKRKRR